MNRICRLCNRELPIENFQTYYHSTQKQYRTRHQCKYCRNKQAQEWKKDRRMKDIPEYRMQFLKNYLKKDILRYSQEVGKYDTEEQREAIKIFMLDILNWNYDEKTDTFYKPGVKEIDGTWPKLKKRRYNVNGTRKHYNEKIKKETVEEMKHLRQYMSWRELSIHFGINDTTLHKWYNEAKD